MTCCNKKKPALKLSEINAVLEFYKTKHAQINKIDGGISTSNSSYMKVKGKVETKDGFVVVNGIEGSEDTTYNVKIRCYTGKETPVANDEIVVNKQYRVLVLSVTPVELNRFFLDIKGKLIKKEKI